MLIKELSINDKPRERAKNIGLSYLTTSELLALIIRTGTKDKSAIDIANDILSVYPNLDKLKSCKISELNKIRGMGDAKTISLLAALELSSRYKFDDNPVALYKIDSPQDIYSYLKRYQFNTRQEEFYILCLNVRREVIASKMIFKGTVESSIIHPRDIFLYALECSATFVIFAHNHPSRNLTASNEDISVTLKLDECGKLLNIKVLDHIIFSDTNYSSFKQLEIF